MFIFHDDTTQLHRTVEGLGSKIIDALECPERITAILQAVATDENHQLRMIVYSDSAADEANDSVEKSTLLKLLSESHDTGYLDHLRSCYDEWVRSDAIKDDETVLPECFPVIGLAGQIRPPKDMFARAGYYAFDLSTGISRHTWTSALASANLAVEAARSIAMHEQTEVSRIRNALALCRPPGHHCTTKMAGGYCYLNNAVIAVQALRMFSPQNTHDKPAAPVRVAILDLDFHHGNGTQSYFYSDPSVLYISIHGEHEYPYYTGFEDEIGDEDGRGYNLNLPLAVRSSVEAYLQKVEIAVRKTISFAPTYLVVSLGFDTFHLDPLGGFDLQTEHYEIIARKIRWGTKMSAVPSLILLEGGYFLDKLGENMLRFLKGWENEI